MFVHLRVAASNDWAQVLQSHIDMKEVFGADVLERGLHIGFTASTTKWDWASFRIRDLQIRASTSSPALTRLTPKGGTVGAFHDKAALPFHFELDMRDSCDHPRLTGGENLHVTLTSPNLRVPLVVPPRGACTEKPGRGKVVGVCDRGDGIYDVRLSYRQTHVCCSVF